MKSVLISIQPKWCELIASGKKTVEVRKTAPKLKTPFKCYIYCTASDVHSCLMVGGGETKLIHCCNYKTAIPVGGEIGSGKVIGEFVCDRIEEFHEWQLSPQGKFQSAEQVDLDLFLECSCLSYEEVCAYRENLPYYKPLYSWQISDLKIYDKPKELGEFKPYCNPNTCVGCKYFHSGASAETTYCSRKPLARPFQSWGYVEEL